MTTTMSGQERFKTMKLPRAIVAIHNAMDDIEKAKKKRAALGEMIQTKKQTIAGLMRKNRSKLGVLPRKGILYKFNGYECQLTADEKVTTKISSES